jgi:hypothetical protein
LLIDPENFACREEYAQEFYRLRQRRGVTLASAREQMDHRNIFGSVMVRMGDADAIVSGVTQNYPDTIRPALQVIGVREGIHKVSGVYLMGDLFFLADATVNIEPTAEDWPKSRFAPRRGRPLRRGAARCHAVIFQFRRYAAPLLRQDASRCRVGSLCRPDTHHRRRGAG